jgi:dynein heavy chain
MFRLLAGNLADWAHNIISFNEAFNIVKPLEEEKNQAEETVKQKNKELKVVKERVRVLNEKVANLEKQLNEAEEQEKKVETERAHYQRKLEFAQKLVQGLASENERWMQSVKVLEDKRLTVIGDTLLAAEFVSCIAPFTSKFRLRL